VPTASSDLADITIAVERSTSPAPPARSGLIILSLRCFLVLGKVVASLAALQAVVAAILHQAYIVFAHAEVAILVARALFFHFVADVTPESCHGAL
jgi:hypothetical protein